MPKLPCSSEHARNDADMLAPRYEQEHAHYAANRDLDQGHRSAFLVPRV